jgi:hypothetical protein
MSQINPTCPPDHELNFNTVEGVWRDIHWHGTCSWTGRLRQENTNELGPHTDQQYTPGFIINFNRKRRTKKSWK